MPDTIFAVWTQFYLIDSILDCFNASKLCQPNNFVPEWQFYSNRHCCICDDAPTVDNTNENNQNGQVFTSKQKYPSASMKG